jgi:hypothetical protein
VRNLAVKEDVKAAIVRAGWSISAVNDELNRRHNTNYTVQNLSNKLSRGSLRYREAVEIADIIGFEIEWKPKRT